MMEEKKLKLCPFCGETPHIWRVDLPLLCRSGEDIRFSVVCNSCDLLFGFDEGYGGVFDTEQEATEAWNRRMENHAEN